MSAGQITPQVGDQVGGGGVPEGGILGQQLEDDGLERLGDVRPVAVGRHRPLLHLLQRHRRGVLGHERRPADDQLVKHDPERVQVGLAAERLALGLLGREIGGRAQNRPGPGQVVGGGGNQGGGDPEVGHLHRAVVVHQDVAELHIAMHEPGLVGSAQRVGHVGTDLRGPVGVQRAGRAQHVGHAPPLHILHHQVVSAPFLTPVIDADDVGMVQVGRGLGLPAEALHETGLVGVLGEQDLERDLAVEEGVSSQIDVSHAAAGQVAQKRIAAVEHGRARF